MLLSDVHRFIAVTAETIASTLPQEVPPRTSPEPPRSRCRHFDQPTARRRRKQPPYGAPEAARPGPQQQQQAPQQAQHKQAAIAGAAPRIAPRSSGRAAAGNVRIVGARVTRQPQPD